jgi:hypothetical protein
MSSDLAEVVDRLITESMDFLEVSSESGAIIKSSDTQGALVKARRFSMRSSFGRVVRPVCTIGTSVVVIGLWVREHVLTGFLIGSVFFVDMYFKGDATDEP